MLKQAPGFYRFRLGDYEIVALHEGVLQRDRPSGFVRNAADDAVAEAYGAIGLPANKLTITFNTFVINTGRANVLIDAGLGDSGGSTTGKLTSNLEAAGILASEIDAVVVSHFHADHIAGLRSKDGDAVYPNAEIAVPEREWAYWMDDERMNAASDDQKATFMCARRVFSSDRGNVRRYSWGEELLPGLVAVDAEGHTPGHTAIQISSGDQTMLFAGDITNNPAVFARHPEWQAMFDMDPAKAVDTRRRLLNMAAAEKLQFAFYHASFPAIGTFIKEGEGYHFIPSLWTSEL